MSEDEEQLSKNEVRIKNKTSLQNKGVKENISNINNQIEIDDDCESFWNLPL